MTQQQDSRQPHPGPIAASAEFPMQWENPEDALLFWNRDKLHYPGQTTPLNVSAHEKFITKGFNNAFRAYDIPIRIRILDINTHVYTALEGGGGGDWQPSAELSGAMAGIEELWETVWLPEIQQHLDYWESYDVAGATMSGLLEHWRETETRLERGWEIHFLLWLPMLMNIGEFVETYHDLFPDCGTFDAYSLLCGFASKGSESGQQLWELSRKALRVERVRQVLTESPAEEVIARLSASAEGQSFLAEIESYLAIYGHQQGDKASLSENFWIEEPTPVIQNLQGYMAQPDRDIGAEMAQVAVCREEGVARARLQMRGYPAAIVSGFDQLLRAAQVSYWLREEHNYWIDNKLAYYTRRLIMEIGRRLAESAVIEGRDDVLYLTIEEMKEAAGGLAANGWQSLIAERKARARRYANVILPPVLGTLPSGPPTHPVMRKMINVVGGMAAPAAPDEVGGIGGSPGVVQGVARVVNDLADAARLGPGDILVAPMMAPAWTSFFGCIGGVVTDSGGILSHCAIVAREYGIPAVVGTGRATAVIRDGQRIEINGNKGVVRILGAE